MELENTDSNKNQGTRNLTIIDINNITNNVNKNTSIVRVPVLNQ